MPEKKARLTTESCAALDAWLRLEGITFSAMIEAYGQRLVEVRLPDGTFPDIDPWPITGHLVREARIITSDRRSRKPGS